MAIAEMSLIRLVGLKPEKDLIINGLVKTGAVQIKNAEDYKQTSEFTADDFSVLKNKK